MRDLREEQEQSGKLIERAKIFLILDIAVFHIIPPILSACVPDGEMMLSMMFLTMLNPLYAAFSAFAFALTKGFSVKYLLLKSLLGGLSVAIYYGYPFTQAVAGLLIAFVVYGLAALVGMLIGRLFYRGD